MPRSRARSSLRDRELPAPWAMAVRVEGQYDVDLRVYFGQPDPGGEMLAEAQAELDRLELPDWGTWELE